MHQLTDCILFVESAQKVKCKNDSLHLYRELCARLFLGREQEPNFLEHLPDYTFFFLDYLNKQAVN